MINSRLKSSIAPQSLQVSWQVSDIRILEFWVFCYYRKKGKTMNSENYMALLDRLIIEIKNKRRHMQNKKTLFHKCHKTMKTMVKLNELLFKSLSHPLYPLDVASSNY